VKNLQKGYKYETYCGYDFWLGSGNLDRSKHGVLMSECGVWTHDCLMGGEQSEIAALGGQTWSRATRKTEVRKPLDGRSDGKGEKTRSVHEDED
jgi:hypothetical protein